MSGPEAERDAEKFRPRAAPASAEPAPGAPPWLDPALAAALADLEAHPKAWDFYAAVRAAHAAFPGSPGVGRADTPEEEPIRFRQRPSLGFVSAPIVSAGFAESAGRPVYEIEQVFFGAFGPNGPLPSHVTTDAMREASQGRPWLARFLDLFTHRITAFLYRAWESAQPAVSRELGPQDPWPAWIGALYGGGPPEFRDRDALPDDLRRYASGWLASGRRSAAALEGVMSVVIGRPVTVEQFAPDWLPMADAEQARLGAGSCTLGVDAALGPRFFSVTSRVRVRTDALDYDTFASLLPDGRRFAAARDAARSLMGLAWGWELKPALAEAEIPPMRLDGARRLGWDSWIGAPPGRGDADDLTLRGDAPISRAHAV